MNAMDWVFLLAALAVGIGLFVFVIAPSAPSVLGDAPALSLSFPANSEINTPFSGTLTGEHLLGKTILFFDGDQTQTFPCTEDPCLIPLTLTYSSPGTRTLEVRSEALHADHRIRITSTQRVCIDGTTDGACATPPLRCVNAKLVPDCTACGCSDGMTCESGTCVRPAVEYAFNSLALDGTAYTTKPSTLLVSLTPISTRPVSGTFVLFLDEYSNTTGAPLASMPHTITLSDVSPNTPYAFSFTHLLQASTHYLGARWFALGSTYTDETLLGQTTVRTSVNVNVDTMSPSAPGTLSYSLDGDTLHLSWEPSPSPDAATYRVYQQNTATGGFTAYTKVQETSALTYSLAHPDVDTAFVIRALDAAGNESPASAPLVVPAS